MRHLQQALFKGLSFAARPWLAVPLYLIGLGLGLLQSWPTAWAGAAGPLLTPMALGETDAWLRFGFSVGGPTLGGGLLLWLSGALLAVFCYASTYNLFSGGALSVMAGRRNFKAGCARFFWSFTGLGILLMLLALFALVVAVLVGTFAGWGPGVAVALILLHLVSLVGEYGRAVAIVTEQRHPFALLGGAVGCLRRHLPGVLALTVLGLLLHSGVAVLTGSLGERVGYAAPLVQQSAALAWVWVKQLRLGWALAYVTATSPGSADLRLESHAGTHPL